MLTLRQALADPRLLGASPAFQDLKSWVAWFDFGAAVYGEPLGAESAARFCKHTGLSEYKPPPGGFAEVVAIVARQSGKTRLGATMVTREAAFSEPCHAGELYALLLAQGHRAAIRTAFSYLTAGFEASPVLRRSIVRKTSDTIELANGIPVAAYPCRSEVLGEFRAGVSTLLDPELIAACVRDGPRELAPAEGGTYQAFTDPSGEGLPLF